jgi:hypothetical protein
MIQNCYSYAWERRGQTTCHWGKDSTGLIEYKINDQGFRSPWNYDTIPDYAFFGNSIVFGVGVDQAQTLVSHFENSHNYGLSGNYMNHHSVTNLQQFVASELYSDQTRVVFFWIDRLEPIEDMIQQVNQLIPRVLHISSGQKKRDAINLMPHIDNDVSGTHPGPKTHRIWAKTIKLLLDRD